MTTTPPVSTPVDFDPFGTLLAPERLPLTAPQAELWTAAAMDDDANRSYNQCFVFTFEGPLRVASLHAALDQAIARHDALRVVFSADGSGQTVRPPFSLEVPLVDLAVLDPDSRRQEIDRLVERECETPFDLAEGPLVRAFVARESANLHYFVVTAHHIVCDGWSSSVLFSDLGRLYVADCVGIPAQVGPAASYQRYVADQTSAEHARTAAVDEAYWAAQYPAGTPVLELPLERPRPAVKTYRCGQATLRIGNELYTKVKKTGARSGATLFATLLAAYEALVYRLSGQSDFVVGVPFAGQLALENPALVAHCVNMVPLRVRLDATVTFVEHLRAVRQGLAEAQDHSNLTFGSLVRRLRIPRDRSRTPLVVITFNIDKVGAPFDFGDVSIVGLRTPKAYSNFELLVNVVDSGSDIVVECEYNADLFDASTLRRWLSHFETLLQGIVERPEDALDALPVLSEEDKKTILDTWNDTSVSFPEERRLHRLFEAQVRRTPDHQAVVDGALRVSYAELNTRANRLAHHLRRSGVGPEVPVGVCLQRDASLIVALLAVLKAGGAYVPLDPAYPEDRVAFMLQDSRARAIVTRSDMTSRLAAPEAQPVLLDAHSAAIALESPLDPDGGAAASNLAYVIYTSGSTGVPKGVAIEHRSAGTLLHWARTVFSDAEIAGMLASTSVCFDLSVFEIFFPLAFGGRVVLADHAIEIATIPAGDEVTLVNTVPSAAAEILRTEALPRSVATVCLAGEPLPTSLVDQLYATGHVKRVYDLYGPSEDTTYSTFALRQPGARPTIGRPISNTRAYVLGPRQDPVPVGVAGELYLAGDGLARGYLHREELTAERFVSASFDGRPVERAYRTGDLARYRPSGELEFLGRNDQQVKIRGFRIELGEIEAVLRGHPGVKEAAVAAREDRPGDRRLVAYVSTEAESNGLVQALRKELRAKLPEYMVPASIVRLPALPLTANGKIDRKRLPAPEMLHLEPQAPPEPLSTEMQRIVAKVWSELLEVAEIRPRDNFFDLGGHSLLAIGAVHRLQSLTGVRLHYRDLIFQTLEQIAASCEEHVVANPAVPAVTTPRSEKTRPEGGSLLGRLLRRDRS